MNHTLAKLSRRGTFKWIGKFDRFITEHDFISGKDIEKAILTNIQTLNGKIVALEHKVNLSHVSQSIKEKLYKDAMIMFTASVEQKMGYTKTYEMVGIDNVLIFSPALVNTDSLKETVWNMKKEDYSINEISFLVSIHSDLIHRIIRENEELLAELNKKTQMMCSAVNNLLLEGYSRKEVGEIFNIAVSTVTTYIPIKKDRKLNFALVAA